MKLNELSAAGRPGDTELDMEHTFPKQAFLDDLRARNTANLELVQATFAPLDRAARSAQPEPGEWCVDQCVQHLVLAYDLHMKIMLPVLERDRGTDASPTFTRSWMAQKGFYRNQFEPASKAKTLGRTTPSDHYYPDVYTQFAAQKARIDGLFEQAQQADLQRRCWFLRFVPINLGDYLEMFVLHDDLHIDQAQRALAAYQEHAAA